MAVKLKSSCHRESYHRGTFRVVESCEEGQSRHIRRLIRKQRWRRVGAGRRNQLVQTEPVISIINAEWNIKVRNDNLQLQSSGAAWLVIRSGNNLKPVGHREVGKFPRERRKCTVAELQFTLMSDKIHSHIDERRKSHCWTDDGNTIFKIGHNLAVATWENHGIDGEVRERPTTAGRDSAGVKSGDNIPRIIPVTHLSNGGEKSDRTDRIDVEASDIVFAAHIEP